MYGQVENLVMGKRADVMNETQNADTFNDIPLDSSTGPVYDDPDEDAGSGSESLDSYEVPIRASARQEDHTYRVIYVK